MIAASEGWELVGMTGAVGADHAVYLRRPHPGEAVR